MILEVGDVLDVDALLVVRRAKQTMLVSLFESEIELRPILEKRTYLGRLW